MPFHGWWGMKEVHSFPRERAYRNWPLIIEIVISPSITSTFPTQLTFLGGPDAFRPFIELWFGSAMTGQISLSNFLGILLRSFFEPWKSPLVFRALHPKTLFLSFGRVENAFLLLFGLFAHRGLCSVLFYPQAQIYAFGLYTNRTENRCRNSSRTLPDDQSIDRHSHLGRCSAISYSFFWRNPIRWSTSFSFLLEKASGCPSWAKTPPMA